MSKRKNGTKRAAAVLGINPYGWGNGGRRKRKKKPQRMEPPRNQVTNKLIDTPIIHGENGDCKMENKTVGILLNKDEMVTVISKVSAAYTYSYGKEKDFLDGLLCKLNSSYAKFFDSGSDCDGK